MNPLVTPNGNVARASVGLKPPAGMSKFFGYVVDDGSGAVHLGTIKIEDLVWLTPNTKGPGYVAVMKFGIQALIPDVDAVRLMKALGWSDGTASNFDFDYLKK